MNGQKHITNTPLTIVFSSTCPASYPILTAPRGALDPPPAAGVGDTAGGKGVTGPLLSRPPRPESFREDTEVSLQQRHQCCGGGGGNDSAASDAVRRRKSSSGREDRDRPAVTGDIAGGGGGGGGAVSGTPGAVDSDSAAVADQASTAAAGHSGACHELAAAAESGWDFSSRWAGLSSRNRSASTAASEDRDKSMSSVEEDGEDEEEGEAFRLCATATTSVVPVDLNAFLHRAELNIARLHHALAGHRTNRKEAPSSETAEDLTLPVPPLLSLDGIQRRFLSRRRCSMKSWSSMSSTLMEKLARQGELGFGSEEADTTSPTASGGDGGLGLESRPLSRKAMLFAAAARARAKAMEQTMWDGRSAFWRDLLLPTGKGLGEYLCKSMP